MSEIAFQPYHQPPTLIWLFDFHKKIFALRNLNAFKWEEGKSKFS